MTRIICIGNPFAYPDDFGMAVYEELKKVDLDSSIEVVEGGVGGLSLFPYFEDDAKILIVDYGSKEIGKILTRKDVDKIEIDGYDHANAFLYLLKSVDKEYKIYLCSEEYDRSNLSKYVKEILDIAKRL